MKITVGKEKEIIIEEASGQWFTFKNHISGDEIDVSVEAAFGTGFVVTYGGCRISFKDGLVRPVDLPMVETVPEKACDDELAEECDACDEYLGKMNTPPSKGQTRFSIYAAELRRRCREIAKLQKELDGYKEAHDDEQRLVRELDIIINGEEGAAKQASLCDIVAQMMNKKRLEEIKAIRVTGMVDNVRLADLVAELIAAVEEQTRGCLCDRCGLLTNDRECPRRPNP